MKTVCLVLFAFTLGCSSQEAEKNEVDPTVALNQAYADFQANLKEPAAKYLDSLRYFKARARQDALKDEIIPENAKSITLICGGEKSNIALMDNIQGMEFRWWGDALAKFEIMVTKPLEAFEPPHINGGRYEKKQRLQIFRTLVESFEAKVRNPGKYVIVVHPTRLLNPTTTSKGYNMGEFEGRVLIYDFQEKSLLASVNVTAQSSQSIRQKSGNARSTINNDFRHNIDKAIDKVLNKHFTGSGRTGKVYFKKLERD